MTGAAGIDVGSTYTKAAVIDSGGRLAGRGLVKTGFKLAEAARRAYDAALEDAGIAGTAVGYIVATGYGRFQVTFADVHVTDLTAAARGARHLFPATRTILDVGGQTMKATRVDAGAKVRAFRLNDKCAAGTGAFLEKTARYLGFSTEEIGPLAMTSKSPANISGVCAVFAESEVINHLSQGTPPSDIMQGAIQSLVDRSIQLMRRVQLEPEYTLVGGILRFESMGRLLVERLAARGETPASHRDGRGCIARRMQPEFHHGRPGAGVNLPPQNVVQFVAALGAAVLARQRLERANTARQDDQEPATTDA